ncbi:unnamed protein product [Mytilus coruscus]|uniref:C-type lectin domain-containing protein n=1 Tax=Mytilus coruscus TaxID=42192 RepID=A0A6J8AIA0_MYTCO|nr:unnamed protein product [Mytilus coruscus]
MFISIIEYLYIFSTVKTLGCDVGWKRFMSSCYYFEFESVKTCYDAKSDCHSKGGYLVKIDNKVENWFSKSYLQTDNNKDGAWIGAHDTVQESNFIWESENTSFTFTDWHPDNPNDAGSGEDCASMRKLGDYNWNDASCSLLYSYICEKQK